MKHDLENFGQFRPSLVLNGGRSSITTSPGGLSYGALELYPNPARESLRLTWPVRPGSETLEVYAADGRRVWSQAVPLSDGHITLSVAEFSEGLYVGHFAGTTVKFAVVR